MYSLIDPSHKNGSIVIYLQANLRTGLFNFIAEEKGVEQLPATTSTINIEYLKTWVANVYFLLWWSIDKSTEVLKEDSSMRGSVRFLTSFWYYKASDSGR